MRLVRVLATSVALAVASATSIASAQQPGWNPRDVAYPGVILVRVDATDVQRGIFRIGETVPVPAAGPVTLLFPKWVPGNHAATAPIERLAGLVIKAGGKRLTWVRDPVDMNAFHVDVPEGAAELDVRFDYL